MNIPNDQGNDWRLKKFVEYQHFVPPVQYEIFKSYTSNHSLSPNDQVYLSWLMSNTYQEVTSLILLEEVPYGDEFGRRFDEWYKSNKSHTIIGSSKKHMAYMSRLENTMYDYERTFGNNPAEFVMDYLSNTEDPVERSKTIKNRISKIKNMGRFAQDYFVETLHLLQKQGYNSFNFGDEMTVDYYNGSNLTSALFNINYMDDLADRYDAGEMGNKELSGYSSLFDETIKTIDNTILETYGERVESTFFVTKLCSFRNLFKNSRYGGFHHDRQLGYIRRYQKTQPSKETLLNEILDIRSSKFKHSLLGETNGWDDVRSERKRIWTEHGFTGVEAESNLVIFNKKRYNKENTKQTLNKKLCIFD